MNVFYVHYLLGIILPTSLKLARFEYNEHLDQNIMASETAMQTDQLSDVESLNGGNMKTVDSFSTVMQTLCEIRREITTKLLNKEKVPEKLVTAIENIKNAIEAKMNPKHSITLALDTGMEMQFNVRDELAGLEKDLKFLQYVQSGFKSADSFLDFLASSHPHGKKRFYNEVAQLEYMLMRRVTDGLDVFITDWDGTYKTYCCNYRTSVQPAYSAYWLSLFAKKCAPMSAVLTAGPLRDFGILDLIAVPAEKSGIIFGGSWGREWLIKGKRMVNKSYFCAASEIQLKDLATKLSDMINAKPEYHRFLFTGSGFQKKVDRVTIGVQTVKNDVSEEEINAFLDSVNQVVQELDPHSEIFVQHKERLDIEIILKTTTQGTWSKAEGIKYLLDMLEIPASNRSIWICGDTVSDLPMVQYAIQANRAGTIVTFVSPPAEVMQFLVETARPDGYCIVGCPEVIHVAMARVLRKCGALTT
ncbi:Trehalose-phosphatase [Trichinella spiralis]|uniref:Trehalose-phosphatase n=1 Tax=Trichinella spiralis TaxID=6334 RepID=A0ABR3KL74_TRISP